MAVGGAVVDEVVGEVAVEDHLAVGRAVAEAHLAAVLVHDAAAVGIGIGGAAVEGRGPGAGAGEIGGEERRHVVAGGAEGAAVDGKGPLRPLEDVADLDDDILGRDVAGLVGRRDRDRVAGLRLVIERALQPELAADELEQAVADGGERERHRAAFRIGRGDRPDHGPDGDVLLHEDRRSGAERDRPGEHRRGRRVVHRRVVGVVLELELLDVAERVGAVVAVAGVVVRDGDGAVRVLDDGVVGMVAAEDDGVDAVAAVDRVVAEAAGDRVVEPGAGIGVAVDRADEGLGVGVELLVEERDAGRRCVGAGHGDGGEVVDLARGHDRRLLLDGAGEVVGEEKPGDGQVDIRARQVAGRAVIGAGAEGPEGDRVDLAMDDVRAEIVGQVAVSEDVLAGRPRAVADDHLLAGERHRVVEDRIAGDRQARHVGRDIGVEIDGRRGGRGVNGDRTNGIGHGRLLLVSKVPRIRREPCRRPPGGRTRGIPRGSGGFRGKMDGLRLGWAGAQNLALRPGAPPPGRPFSGRRDNNHAAIQVNPYCPSLCKIRTGVNNRNDLISIATRRGRPAASGVGPTARPWITLERR